MRRCLLWQILLVNQQRRHKPADDHQLRHQIAQLGGEIKARGLYPRKLVWPVTCGGRWFFRHGCPFSKVLCATARPLPPPARDDPSNPDTPAPDEHTGSHHVPPRRGTRLRHSAQPARRSRRVVLRENPSPASLRTMAFVPRNKPPAETRKTARATTPPPGR